MSRGRLTIAIAGLAAIMLGAGALIPLGLSGGREGAPRRSDPKVLARRALSYLEESRATADPTLLPEAERLLRRALEVETEPAFEARVGLASLSNARHDFRASVRWANEAIELNPHHASAYGLLGDALFELGRYDAADRAYQLMLDVRPDLASYTRASYALQFRGDTEGGLEALHRALEAAGPVGSSHAFIRHQLGDVYMGAGLLKQAARQNRIGTKVAPGFVPPTVGLAEVAIARGDLARATTILEKAVVKLPSLEYLIQLGDLYSATGRGPEAKRQYAVVAERLALYRANGVLPDVDFLLFYADHGLRPGAAVAEARAVYRDRPTPAASDALAWTLFRSGFPKAAWRYARRTVTASPGTDGNFHLHAALIARDLGRSDVARTQLDRALALEATLSVVEQQLAERLVGILE
jgi:tetratricopeptide (TPR) repeat protein